MGDVYKAYDTYRDRYVALKLLPEALSGDREYLKRFQRESNVAARLTEPHVIPIHDFGELDGQLFIDMRLVDGADIGVLLEEHGRMTPQRAVHLISQVAEALDAAHADHLVHRDIKPSNILVTPSDFVYVVDFGIARSIGSRQTPLTIAGATIGTWDYMAPERFAGHAVDGRADIYSLACVLHECLTGAPPFADKDLPALLYAQLYSAPPPASSLVAGVPPALDAVIARGMAKDPKDRFQTAGTLAAAAREALGTEASAAPAAELPAPAWSELPEAAWQAAPAFAGWQDMVRRAGPQAQPPGDRFAQGVAHSPTQTVLPGGVGDWGGTRSPESTPPGPGHDPGVPLPSGTGPAGAGRGPARRRLGVLIAGAAVIAAVPVVIVLLASSKPGTPGSSPTLRTGGATSPSATGTSSGAPSVALPTFAQKISVGAYPSYIKVAPNGQFAYVVSLGTGAITVLNTATDTVSGTIKIPQGLPQYVSFSPDSRTAYVSVFGNGSVPHIAFIDTATGDVTASVAVDNFTPGPSTTSPDGRFLYVPNHNTVTNHSDENLVDVIDTTSKTLIASVPVKANPHWVVFSKDGSRYYTTDHLSATVTVVSTATNDIITNISVGETPHSEALSPDGSRLAVTSANGNEVFLINTATEQMIKQIPVGQEPLGIAYSPDGRYLLTVNNGDNTVTVIDTADDLVIDQIPTGKGPTSISVLPNGRQAYVTDENDGTVEILNLPQYS